ncbi:hypothetical protein ACQ4M3_05560 [Leptolyngbya sp. AN03gr2]|uniref:hypothetical protein n=1 Tax=unclassified Leptolyngbya TaxID=2650499 RepID=UPI003D316A39
MTRSARKPNDGLQRRFALMQQTRWMQLVHEHSDLWLSIVLGATLFLEDRILQDPTLTAFLILFGLTFLFSIFPRISSRIRSLSRPLQYVLASICLSSTVLITAPIVFAQAAPGNGAACGGGLFGPLASFFSAALTTGGNDVCTLFGLIQAALVVVFVIAIGVAVYQVGQGAEFRSAFTPVALALVVVVAAGIIIRLFMGTGTTAATGQGN